ncbi:hypothetical protein, partial [Bacillus altitudinis]|uniref:hypothetical protein n=1 Tax=Bacillus altitudinis TaxID=293387 RepID=UPI0011A612A0
KGNEMEGVGEDFEKLCDEGLGNKRMEFKEKVEKGECVEEVLVEGFGRVGEGWWGVRGMLGFKVELMGGIGVDEGN